MILACNYFLNSKNLTSTFHPRKPGPPHYLVHHSHGNHATPTCCQVPLKSQSCATSLEAHVVGTKRKGNESAFEVALPRDSMFADCLSGGFDTFGGIIVGTARPERSQYTEREGTD